MLVNIYKSRTTTKYLFVPVEKSVSVLIVNDKDMKEVTLFKTSLNLSAEKPRISINTEEAILAIQTNGYYITRANVEVTQS